VPRSKRHNRKFGSVKGAKEFRAQVPKEVFDFFEANALDEHNCRRSRGKILEILVQAVGKLPDKREEEAPGLVSHKSTREESTCA